MAAKELFPALKKSNVSENLKVIEKKETDDIRFIEVNKIKPSPLNKYPIVDIERLAESIKTWGLIHNLLVVKSDDPDFEYEILSGERRFAAIDLLLKQGDETFKNGIRARVIGSTNDIDKEIMLIEANEEVRDDDPARRRQMIQRLEDLYKARAEKNGTTINTISKDISNQIGIGERQVQRYRAVNTLIPELTEAFDKGNVNLEKAASLSKLSEDAQKIIANLLGEFKSTEIDLLKKEAEKIAMEKDSQNKLLNEKIKTLSEQYERESSDLKVKLEFQEKQLNQNQEEEIDLRKKIDEELKNQNEQKVKELEDKLLRNSKDKENLLESKKQYEQEKKSIEKKLADKDREIENLKKQIEENTKVNTTSLSKNDQQKLKLKFELQNIITDVKKAVNNLIVKSENFHKLYDEEADLDESIKELVKHISDKLTNI